MANVGGVEIDVRLAREALARDIRQAEQMLGQLERPIRLDVDSSGLGKLASAADYFTRSVSEASQYTQALGVVSAQLANVGNELDKVGDAALAQVAALDSAQTKVKTLGADADDLTARMTQLSGDLRRQVDATTLLDASYDVLSSGITDAAAVTKVMEAATYASVGGFTTTATATDALTSAMNAYGQETYSAAKVADILIATQNAGKITVNEYGSLIGKVATIAAQAGVSLEELSGFVANATVKGVKASSAVDGFRASISAVLKPSKEAAELAQSLGIEFNAAALKTKGMVGILTELNRIGKDDQETLVKLFGSVEAVTALAPSTGAGLAELNKQIGYISDSGGLAKKTFDTMADSMEGRAKAAATEMKDALLALGQGVQAVVMPLAAMVTLALQGFNALPAPIKSATGAVIALTAGAVTLGATAAGIAATLPVIAAGLTAVGSLLGVNATAATATAAATGVLTVAEAANTVAVTANAAATTADTAATIANTSATSAHAGTQLVDTAATTANTAATAANTAAATANAVAVAGVGTAATSTAVATTAAGGASAAAAGSLTVLTASAQALLVSLAPLAAKLAVFLLAVDAVAVVWRNLSVVLGQTPELKSLDSANAALAAIDATAKQTAPSLTAATNEVKGLGDAFEAAGSQVDLGRKGIFGSLQDSSAALVQSLATGRKELTAYGEEFRILGVNIIPTTQAQLNAQQVMEKLGGTIEQVHGRLDAGQDILDKYGGAQLTAAEATALGKDGLAAYNKEAAEQIEAIDGYLKALGEVKTASPEQQSILDANIKLLQRQKETLVERTEQIAKGTSALGESTAANQAETASLSELDQAYDQQLGQLDLLIEKRKQAAAAADNADTNGAASSAALDKTNTEDRLKIVQEQIAKLQAAKGKLAGAEATKAEAQLTKLTLEGEKLRTRIAELGAKDRERVRQQQVKDAEAAGRKEAAAAEASSAAQLKSARAAYASGAATKAELANAEAAASEARIKKELELNEKAQQRLLDLRSKGAIGGDEYDTKQAALIQRRTALEEQLSQRQVAQQEKASAAAEKAAADQAQAAEKAARTQKAAAEKADRDRKAAAEKADRDKKAAAEKAARDREAALEKANQAAIRRYEQDVNAAEGAINAKFAKEEAGIRRAAELRGASEQQLAADLAGLAERRATVEQAAVTTRVAQVTKLRRDGVLTQEQAEEKLAALREQHGQLELRREEAKAAQIRATQQERLRVITDTAAQERQATDQAYEHAVASAKQVALARRDEDTKLAIELATLAERRASANVAATTRELAAVAAARGANELGAQDAAKRTSELKDQLAKQEVEQINAATEVMKVQHADRLRQLDEQVTALSRIRDIEGLRMQLVDQVGNRQQAYAQAYMDELKAAQGLDLQRLNMALEGATTDEQRLQLTKQIGETRVAFLAEEQERERELSHLREEATQRERERAAIVAEVVVAEAELAVIKARESGASKEQLDSLVKVLNLQERLLALSREAVARDKEGLDMSKRRTEELKRQADMERLKAETAKSTLEATRKARGDTAASDVARLASAPPVTSLASKSVLKAADAMSNNPSAVESPPRATSDTARSLVDQASVGGIIDLGGRRGADEMLRTISGMANPRDAATTGRQAAPRVEATGQLSAELKGLKEAVLTAASKPTNLTVQTPDPVADSVQVLSKLARQRSTAVGGI